MATEIAKAYVQIIPTAKGIGNQLEKELDGASEEAGKEAGKKSGKGFLSGIGGTIAKGAAVLGAAAITATGAIAKSAVDGYAEYEQLVGGANLMFGDAFDTVAENAKNAYKTVQLSQNDYLTQVNGFATGLKTALGGSEQEAALLADKIITAEADVVAATGNSREAVENAFNGIMRSNFTMLDNLQLGITPTKEGFQDLIDSVNAWNAENNAATNYTIDNVADCQAALVDYIEMQGLAGYASNEASETIQGSAESMKAAWQNLLVGMADENANFGELVGNFTDSLVAYADNLVPRIGTAMEGIGSLLTAFAETILPKIVEYITSNLPQIIETGITIIIKLVEGLIKAIPQLIAAVPEIIVSIVGTLKDMWPEIKEAGADLVRGIWEGIKNMGDWLWQQVSGFFSGIIDGVKNFLGIHSPSTVFAEIGGYMAEGLGIGFDDEIGNVKNKIASDVSGLVSDASVTAEISTAPVYADVHNASSATFNLILDGEVISSFFVDMMRKEVRMA